jgi:hypothetical protein
VDAAEDIEITTGPHDRIINMPFLSHPFANKSLYDLPRSCIDRIDIRDFGDQVSRDIFYPVEERYKPPRPSESRMRMEFRSPYTD